MKVRDFVRRQLIKMRLEARANPRSVPVERTVDLDGDPF